MKHIKSYNKFNESLSSVKEIPFDEDMMVEASAIMNICRNLEKDTESIANTIKETLTDDVYNKLFSKYKDLIRNSFDIFNLFTTTIITEKDLQKMFSNVTIHKGSDMEDEYVVALEINNRIVLLLHSPERGSQIRIQDDNYTIKIDEVVSIIRELCKIYNNL